MSDRKKTGFVIIQMTVNIVVKNTMMLISHNPGTSGCQEELDTLHVWLVRVK